MIQYLPTKREVVEYFTVYLYCAAPCPEAQFEFGTRKDADDFLTDALREGVSYSRCDRFSHDDMVFVNSNGIFGGAIRKETSSG